MNIRKLLLPTLIAAALAAPSAFAQDAKDKDPAKDQGQAAAASKTDKAKADAAKADARKDTKQDAKSAKKGSKSGEEQPDEPEEDGR